MAPYELRERTRLLAIAVSRFCRTLPMTDEAQEAARQLRKSGNSVRSNYRAARKGRSRREFQAKLQIAFEEADEVVDWLEHLRDMGIRYEPALLQEAREVSSILATAVRTARRNTDHGIS
jgi:four helix bundle protein